MKIQMHNCTLFSFLINGILIKKGFRIDINYLMLLNELNFILM